MGKYVIFTYDIHPIGGTQSYTAGKARYLEKNGWEVFVFSSGQKKGGFEILYLAKYQAGCEPKLLFPPYHYFDDERKKLIDWMINLIDYNEGDEVVIDSHSSELSFWAELLAERVSGKHIFFPCNETYDDANVYYHDNLDFYEFKRKRKEIFIHKKVLKKIFQGKDVENPLSVWETARSVVEQDMVQDVPCQVIENLPKHDWGITIISRMEKDSVVHMLNGVLELARKYSNKSIGLILIGDATCLNDKLKQMEEKNSNIAIYRLGNQVPVPRILFSKTDVVMAISQTAIFSSYEGKPVLAGNCEQVNLTPGALGYDTSDPVFGGDKPNMTYLCALENALVYHKYDDKSKFTMPEYKSSDYWNKIAVETLSQTCSEKSYMTERFNNTDLKYALRLRLLNEKRKLGDKFPILRKIKRLFVSNN